MNLKTYLICTLSMVLFPGGHVVSQEGFKPSEVLKARMMHADFVARAKEDPEYRHLSEMIEELEGKIETSSPAEQKIQNKILQQMRVSQEKIIDRVRRKMLHSTVKMGSEDIQSKKLYAGRSAQGKFYVSKQLPTAAEMSGALHWAHGQGIKGYGAKVMVLESNRVTHDDVKAHVVRQQGPNGAGSHANMVASVIAQMAPAADIFVNTEFFGSLSVKPNPQIKADPNIDIINNSSVVAKIRNQGFIDFNRGLMAAQTMLDVYPQALVINAIGNSYSLMEDDVLRWPPYTDIKKRLIIALSVSLLRSKGYVTIKIPDNIMMGIKDISLCAMGQEVLTATEGESYHYKSGTSFSTPTIAGAAALIKSKYPHFQAEHLQEVLLESADRTFFTESVQREPSVFVYDIIECPDGPTIAKKLKVRGEEYKDMSFGKGILNLRNAFIYAEMLNEKLKHNLPRHPFSLRQGMLKKIKMDEEMAATTLGQAWRAYQGRKERKALTSSVPPTDSAHGESIPSSVSGASDSDAKLPEGEGLDVLTQEDA